MSQPNADRDEARSDAPEVVDELDALLDLDRTLPVPRGLARRVLGGLRAHEERALDTLLDLGGEHDAAPPGLAAGVLARARREGGVRRRLQWLPGGTLPRAAAAAAVLGLAFGAWRLTGSLIGGGSLLGGQPGDELVADTDPPAELLELLPVLERWEALQGGAANENMLDLDTLLAVDGDDELLLLVTAEDNG